MTSERRPRRPQHRPLAHRRGLRAEPGVPGRDDLRPRRDAARRRRRRVRHRGPHGVVRRPARRSRDRHYRHLPPPPTGRGGARRRQARGLREAADRLARRLRRDHRRRAGRQGRLDADLPVPLRRRHRKAKRIIDAGIAGKLYAGSVETFWKRTPDTTPCPGAANGRRARRRARHPRAAPARHGAAARRPGGAGVRPGHDPRQRHRGRGLRLGESADGGRRAPLADHPRLAGRDQPAAAALRARHLRVFARRLFARQRPWQILAASDAVQRRIDAAIGNWQPVGPRFTTQMAHFAEALDGRRRCR